MASKIQFVEAENTDRAYPNAFIIDEAMFKVNGVYVCVEPCGGGGDATFLLGDQYIYISSDGDDTLDEEGLRGTELYPFLTIPAAMDYINSFITINGDIYLVFMDEGPFYIDTTVKINHPNKIIYSGIGGDIEPPEPDPEGWWGPLLVWAGGDSDSGRSDVLQYVDSATATATAQFGILSIAVDGNVAASDSVRGHMTGGATGSIYWSTIEEILFASLSNSAYFADLSIEGIGYAYAVGNATECMTGGGDTDSIGYTNKSEKWTFAVQANAADHGTLGVYMGYHGACNDATIALWGGGDGGPIQGDNDTMDVCHKTEFATASVGTFFGTLTVPRDFNHATGNGTIGVFPGGWWSSASITTIDYFTFATEGNATDWGNVLVWGVDSGGCTTDGIYAYLGGNYSSPNDEIERFEMVVGSACSAWGTLVGGNQLFPATSGG